MAILAVSKEKSLKMQVQVDVDEKGNPVYSTRTLGAVKIDATDDNLFAVAQEAGTLLTPTLNAIKVSESYALETE